jgi:hypothetical protein
MYCLGKEGCYFWYHEARPKYLDLFCKSDVSWLYYFQHCCSVYQVVCLNCVTVTCTYRELPRKGYIRSSSNFFLSRRSRVYKIEVIRLEIGWRVNVLNVGFSFFVVITLYKHGNLITAILITSIRSVPKTLGCKCLANSTTWQHCLRQSVEVIIYFNKFQLPYINQIHNT